MSLRKGSKGREMQAKNSKQLLNSLMKEKNEGSIFQVGK